MQLLQPASQLECAHHTASPSQQLCAKLLASNGNRNGSGVVCSMQHRLRLNMMYCAAKAFDGVCGLF